MDTPRDLASALQSFARRSPGSEAILDAATGETLTYRGFLGATSRVAALLSDLGVGPGERVILVGENSMDLAVMLLGTMLAGALSTPLGPDLAEGEIRRLVHHAEPVVAFADSRTVGALPVHALSAWRDAHPSSIERPGAPFETGGLLMYTSGTTGDPKGVLLSLEALCINANKAVEWFSLDAEHRTLAFLPLHHTFALVSDVLTMLLSGGSTVIAPTFTVQRLPQIQEAIHRHGVRSFSAVPLVLDAMNRLGADLHGDRMRFCVSGAAPLAESTREVFGSRQGFPIIPAYGLTESCCFCAISKPDAVVPGSAGRPVVDLRILDGADRECPAGEMGEIVIRGPDVVADGYYRDDQPCYVGGWFRTGDLGMLDAEGNLFLTGRIKNMVIRGGKKVYLGDLDVCLRRHASVDDAVTVGLLRETPERIVSFVVARDGRLDARALAVWMEGQVGRGKAPDEIRLIDSIPYTRSGKVRLGVLQAMAEAP